MTDEQHLIEDLRSLAERDQSPGNRLRNALRESANYIETQAKELAAHRTRNDAQVQGLVSALEHIEEYAISACEMAEIATIALAAWEGQQSALRAQETANG